MERLYIVVPCYQEAEMLPLSAPVLLGKLRALAGRALIAPESRLLFVDDGSTDGTWAQIAALCAAEGEVCGVKLSRNRGHQNAVVAGMVAALRAGADAVLTIDADLQDDPDAIDEMVARWRAGAELVCGVRAARAEDSVFKRTTAHAFYALMRLSGAKLLYDHADFRLMSRGAVEKLLCFGTEDLFLRGLILRLGYMPEVVYYARRARAAGESKYTLRKMLHLARRGFESARTPMALSPCIGALYIEKEAMQ